MSIWTKKPQTFVDIRIDNTLWPHICSSLEIHFWRKVGSADILTKVLPWCKNRRFNYYMFSIRYIYSYTCMNWLYIYSSAHVRMILLLFGTYIFLESHVFIAMIFPFNSNEKKNVGWTNDGSCLRHLEKLRLKVSTYAE